MDKSFLQKMTEAVQAEESLSECRCIKANAGDAIPFPVTKTLVCFGMEEADRLDFFLGYDEGLFGAKKLCVSVLCDEKRGGEACEAAAKKVCQTILTADSDRMITSVSAEKCMYDKINFAYKVIMRFALREQLLPI